MATRLGQAIQQFHMINEQLTWRFRKMHKLSRLPWAGAIVVTLAFSLNGCANNTAEEQQGGAESDDSELITINYSAPVAGSLAFLPVEIAIEQGFFEEEGIELVVKQTSAQALPAALSGGQIDMTADTAYNVARYIGNDVPVQVVAGLNDNVDFTLLFSQEMDVPDSDEDWRDTFRALEGTSIGTAAQAGPIGLTVKQLMTEAGVSEGSYTLVDTPGAASGNALAADQIDAVVSGGGFEAPLVENDLGVRVLSFNDGISEFFGAQTNAVLSLSGDFIEDNPVAATKVQSAIEDAVAFIQDPSNLSDVTAMAISSGTPETSELEQSVQNYDYSSEVSLSGLEAAFEWAERAAISSELIEAEDTIADGVETK